MYVCIVHVCTHGTGIGMHLCIYEYVKTLPHVLIYITLIYAIDE